MTRKDIEERYSWEENDLKSLAKELMDNNIGVVWMYGAGRHLRAFSENLDCRLIPSAAVVIPPLKRIKKLERGDEKLAEIIGKYYTKPRWLYKLGEKFVELRDDIMASLVATRLVIDVCRAAYQEAREEAREARENLKYQRELPQTIY